MIRGESTWFKMSKGRDGIEPGDEGNDLLASDPLETAPAEVHWSNLGIYVYK